MSRAFIEVVAAATILGFTGAAYYVATSTLEAQLHEEARARAEQARDQVVEKATLDGLGRLNRVEALAAEPDIARALRAESKQRAEIASLAFRRFVQGLDPAEQRPDIVALTNAGGDVMAMLDVRNPLPDMWKDGNEIEYPAIALALSGKQIISEIWDYEREGLMKVGVAPVMDGADTVLGAMVIAYSVSALEAQRQRRDLAGADIAYFHGDQVYATSFPPEPESGDRTGGVHAQLAQVLASGGLGPGALAQGQAARPVEVTVNDRQYLATAARLPQLSSRPRPANYPAAMAGVLIMWSLSDALAPLKTVKLAILLLGLGAAVLAVLAIEMAARRILAQVDQLEMSVGDILNGQAGPSLGPVGGELEGLASALEVMAARLVERSQAGDDPGGRSLQRMLLDFEEEAPSISGVSVSSADPATMALAQEPEPAYYQRLFDEYLQALRQMGAPVEGIQPEDFVAKLRLSESNLKDRYQCSTVRFRVVVKHGKVTLKPVPIL